MKPVTPARFIIAAPLAIYRKGLESMLRDAFPHSKIECVDDEIYLDGLCKKLHPQILFYHTGDQLHKAQLLIQKLLIKIPVVKVMIVTDHVSGNELLSIVKAGAMGVINKNVSEEELMHAVRVVLRNQVHICKANTPSFQKDDFIESECEDMSELTRRECEILKLIIQGYSTNQIAEKLFLSPRTVESHRFHIHEKTGTHNSIELSNYAKRKRKTV